MEKLKSIKSTIKQSTITPYILLLSILSMCITKIFFCSVSIDGNYPRYCIVCDYWNFTKSMLNGSKLYVDLIDHKGLYLYLLYAPFVLIFKNNMWGVVLAESIIFSGTVVSFYFMIKSKFDKNTSLFFTNLFTLAFLIMSFTRPALFNTDTMLIPFYFLTYGYILNNKKYSNKSFFLIGLMLGFFINIKYSSILYFASLFLFATFLHFYNKNTIKNYFLLILNGLLGVVSINIPFFIYLIKTNTFQKFVYYAILASNTNSLNVILMICLFLICFIFTIFLYKKGNKYFEIFLCLSTLAISYIGMFFNGNYIVVMFLIIAPCCFKKNIKSILFYIACSVLFYISMFIPDQGAKINIKDIAKQYGINNSNIVYVFEDLGFGAYSEESFKEPYQWIPVRFLYKDSFYDEIVELYTKRIVNQEFEFVITTTNNNKDDNPEKIGKIEKISQELVVYLQEYYTPIAIKAQNGEETNIILWTIK